MRTILYNFCILLALFSSTHQTIAQLAISRSGTNVVLKWSTNAVGFTLQSTTNLASPVWVAVSPAPLVISTNNVVTNSAAGKQKFFQLQPPPPFGIYMGNFAGQVDNGGFAMMVRSNGQGVVVVGYNTPQNEGVYATNFMITGFGGFGVSTIQGGTASGTLTSNAITGNFRSSTGGNGTFSGTRKPDTGVQQTNAGYYTGTYSGTYSGNAFLVLAADGTMFFYTQSSPVDDGGGFGTINAANSVSGTTVPDSLTITGTLNPSTHIISGNYSFSGTTLGTYSVTLITSP